MALPPDLLRRLLGRPEHLFALPRDAFHDLTVLVTGAGGSIGAELCRRLLASGVRRVVAVDQNELQLAELMRQPSSSLIPELASIRDRRRMNAVFSAWKPEVVFHAAAYKHLPCNEQFPLEAFHTNTVATAEMADLAEEHAAKRFVLVSTDKAASPTSVLGASKRIAELAILSRTRSSTGFAALRCGNVLGSSGSVLKIWAEEIQAGKPLTVTDPLAERFFVTLQEAAGALLTLATMSDGNGLFTYDLTSPVSVEEMAGRLLSYYGRNAGVLEGTGLRPGEKLSESLLAEDEFTTPTSCNRVLQVYCDSDRPSDLDYVLGEIREACQAQELERLLGAVKLALPAYVPKLVCPVAVLRDGPVVLG